MSVSLTPSMVKKLTVSGVIKDSKGIPKYDPNPDLSQYRLRGLKQDHGEYHRMYTYDGTVRGVNRLIQMEISRADFQFEYRPDESEEERLVRVSCEAMLGINDGEASFPGGLRELVKGAALKTVYGISPFEVCWDYREQMEVDRPDDEFDEEAAAEEATKAKTPPPPPPAPVMDKDGKAVPPPPPDPADMPEVTPVKPEEKPEVVIRMEERICPSQIRWIAPWSIDGWIVDKTDTIKSMVQIQQITENSKLAVAVKDGTSQVGNSYRYEKDVLVPIEKMLIFNHDAVGGNIEGAGMCRSAWAYFRAKMDTLLRNQSTLDKMTDGLFVVEEQGDKDGAWKTVSATDQRELGLGIDAITGGLTNRLWVPHGAKAVPYWPAVNEPNHVESYKYYDYMILVSSLAGVLGLGQTAAGKGLSDGFMVILYHMIEDICLDICDTINGNGHPWTGLIANYIKYNFPDFKGRKPKLTPGQIAFQDMQTLTDTLSKAQQFLGLTQDERDENGYRRIMRLGRRGVKQLRKARKEAAGAAKSASGGSPQPQGGQAAPSQTDKGNNPNQSKKKAGDGSDNEAK